MTAMADGEEIGVITAVIEGAESDLLEIERDFKKRSWFPSEMSSSGKSTKRGANSRSLAHGFWNENQGYFSFPRNY